MNLVNNYSERNLQFFTENFQDLENEANVNFSFINGYADVVDSEVINELVEDIIESTAGDKKQLPIVIWGSPRAPLSQYQTALPPFSLGYHEYDKNPDVKSKNENRLVISEEVDETDSIILLRSPSKHPYGAIKIGGDFPIVYIGITPHDKTFTKYFKFLLKEALHILLDDYPKPLFETKLYGGIKPEECEAFVNTISKDVRRKLKDLDSNIDGLTGKLIAYSRERQEIRAKLNATVNSEFIKKQIDIINSYPYVEWCKLDGNSLVFLDRNVTVEVPESRSKEYGGKYLIGDIVITVELQNGRVYFNNVTQKDGRKSHPHHAGDNGSMCLGEISNFIVPLITDFELAALVELLNNYARSINLNDVAGKTLNKWPKIK